MADLILCGSIFWLLGAIWTILMMADPSVSRIRLFFGGVLWPLLATLTSIYVLVDVITSPFRKKAPQPETEQKPSDE